MRRFLGLGLRHEVAENVDQTLLNSLKIFNEDDKSAEPIKQILCLKNCVFFKKDLLFFSVAGSFLT